MVRTMAATAARCLGAAWPRRLRAQCTRQRWRPAVKTRRAAARRPSWSPQALVVVGDDEPDAAQAAIGERAEELGPEDLGFRGAGRDTQDLAAAVGVDADGDYDGDAGDPPALAGLEVGGVDPEVGPAPLDRPREEGLDALVDVLAQARDLALRDAGAAHRLDQVVDRPGRDAVDVGLLDDRRQRLLGGPARLQEGREVRALAPLRDGQLDPAGP